MRAPVFPLFILSTALLRCVYSSRLLVCPGGAAASFDRPGTFSSFSLPVLGHLSGSFRREIERTVSFPPSLPPTRPPDETHLLGRRSNRRFETPKKYIYILLVPPSTWNNSRARLYGGGKGCVITRKTQARDSEGTGKQRDEILCEKQRAHVRDRNGH